MPSHVENDLFIRGTQSQVDEVLATIGATRNPATFDFNTLIPYPERWAQMDKDAEVIWKANTPNAREAAMDNYRAKWGTENDGFNSGGHDWCVSNWGTKWNAYEVIAIFDRPHIHDDVKRARISFRTAWSAPFPVVEKLAELFPDVEISLEYFEKGMGFSGGVAYMERKYIEMGEPRKEEWHTDDYKGNRGG